jgi:hypothetical protein
VVSAGCLALQERRRQRRQGRQGRQKATRGDAGDLIYSNVDPAYMYSEEDYVNGKVGVVIYFPVTGARPYAGGSYTVTAP